MKLRDYQCDAVEKLRGKYSQGERSILYVLPTGGGKTFVFTYITSQIIQKEKKAIILVHRQELIEQTSKALQKFSIPHGIVASHYEEDLSKSVQVCSVQTLVRRLHKFRSNDFDLLIVDEAHHAVAGSWAKIIDFFETAKVLGVTATPIRLDGKGLKDKFQCMVIGPQMGELMKLGYLSSCRVFAPPSQLNLKIMRKSMGDYRNSDMEDQCIKKNFIGDAVSHYKKYLSGKTAIAFCVSVKHAIEVAAQFRSEGISAAHIDGTVSRDTRKRLLQNLSQGSIKVITSCSIIQEGTDIPSVSGCLLLRPTLSTSVYLQQVGRCLRPSENKTAIILDHVGNVEKHGLPTEVRNWSLNGLKKRTQNKTDTISVKVCPNCFSALMSLTQVCECGHVFRAKDQKFETIDAELQEVKAIKKQKKREQGQARTLQELQALAKKRGFSSGWAYHVFKNRKRQDGNGRFYQ